MKLTRTLDNSKSRSLSLMCLVLMVLSACSGGNSTENAQATDTANLSTVELITQANPFEAALEQGSNGSEVSPVFQIERRGRPPATSP